MYPNDPNQQTFNDGVVRDVDFTGELERAAGTLVEPLLDLDYFRRVRVDHESRTIVWPNGLDPDPDVLHGDFEPVARESTPAPADSTAQTGVRGAR